MRVEVGPMPSESVQVWVGYARTMLGTGGDEVVPPDARQAFDSYLASWERAATEGESFHWADEIPCDVGEYLALAFYRVAKKVADEAPGSLPEDASGFYRVLVERLLQGLAVEGGPSGAEFADHLRCFWPGLAEPA